MDTDAIRESLTTLLTGYVQAYIEEVERKKRDRPENEQELFSDFCYFALPILKGLT